MHKADGDCRFATSNRLDRTRARACVLADVFMQCLHVFKCFVFTHKLNQRSNHGVSGAAGGWISDLNVALVFRLQ